MDSLLLLDTTAYSTCPMCEVLSSVNHFRDEYFTCSSAKSMLSSAVGLKSRSGGNE